MTTLETLFIAAISALYLVAVAGDIFQMKNENVSKP